MSQEVLVNGMFDIEATSESESFTSSERSRIAMFGIVRCRI